MIHRNVLGVRVRAWLDVWAANTLPIGGMPSKASQIRQETRQSLLGL